MVTIACLLILPPSVRSWEGAPLCLCTHRFIALYHMKTVTPGKAFLIYSKRRYICSHKHCYSVVLSSGPQTVEAAGLHSYIQATCGHPAVRVLCPHPAGQPDMEGLFPLTTRHPGPCMLGDTRAVRHILKQIFAVLAKTLSSNHEPFGFPCFFLYNKGV